jgi:hypothetical protein
MLHKIVCRTAVVAGLALALPVAAMACDGADCPAPSKPLDIQKFMREQAASTRVGERHHVAVTHRAVPKAAAPVHTAAKAKPHRTHTARAAAPLPTEAATSFAAQNDPNVEVVASDQLNAIDQAAPVAAAAPAADVFPAPAPAETVGQSPSEQKAQTVVGDAFNEIDSKVTDSALPGNGVRIGAMPQTTPPADAPRASWVQSIWAALGNVFTALAAAVHQLLHL